MKGLGLAKLGLGLLTVLCSVGCATGPSFVEREPQSRGTGIVYLYRPFEWEELPTSPTIMVDGKPHGNLRARGYMDLDLKPGSYSIETKGNRSWTTTESIGVRVNGGDVCFVKLEMTEVEVQRIDLESGQKTGRLQPRFRVVPDSVGRKEIAGCRRCGP